MTYLRDQTQGVYVPNKIYRGTVATNAADMLDRVSVIVPGLDSEMVWEDCRWQSKDNITLPQKGDQCLVLFDDNGELWVTSWWASSYIVDNKWLKGSGDKAIWEDIHARDVLDLASASAISARVYRSTVQTIPPSAYTAIVYDTVRYNDYGQWSATNPTRLTAMRDGTYVIFAQLIFQVVSGGAHRLAAIWLNGTVPIGEDGQIAATSAGAPRANVSVEYKLKVGDYVEVFAFQDSGVNVTTYASSASQAAMNDFGMALIAGAKGDTGATGPPGGGGGGGGGNYEYTQASPASTWSVTHNMGLHPSVTVVDSGGTIVIPDVHYDSTNAVTITFGSATSGKAFFN
jgi:hypothetical protein